MPESRIVIEERTLRELAEIIRDKAGTSEQMNADEMVLVANGIGQPPLEELSATENGEYTPTAYGYSKVTVNVQPELEELTLTTGGIYTPTKYGFSKVFANIPKYRNFEEVEF